MGHASGQLLPAENVLSEEDGTVIFMPGRGSKNPWDLLRKTFFSQMGNLLGESIGHICFAFLFRNFEANPSSCLFHGNIMEHR